MEHSALHALELIGQIVALGGAFFVVGLVWPAARAGKKSASRAELPAILEAAAGRCVVWGAWGAALATALNLFVEAAETQNQTVFGGVSPALVFKFALHTSVGRLSLARIGVLLLTGAVARLPGEWKWWPVLAGASGAIVLTSWVSHAAAQPTSRGVMLAAQVAHIAAAALWVGVLIQLLAARRDIEGRAGQEDAGFLAEIVRRFSPVALAVTSLLGISGVWMVCHFLADTAAVTTSAYGLTLLVKLLLLTPAIYAGFVNFRVIRPALLKFAASKVQIDREAKAGLLRRFGRMLELEVTAGVLVVTVAGILGSVSPPGQAGEYRLTEQQSRAILHPHLPVAYSVNPATFYGAPERTEADLHYAEFTHNWSGVMVCLLGLGWLATNARGRAGKTAEHFWPLLLLPFAAFVALASDPEVWLLRQVSPLQVLRDPQLLEHQLGAVMILILAWLGWRGRARIDDGPLGYVFAVMLAGGGILLLGHAHTTLTATEEVTNLINVQHAVFGTFIISAGTLRWLGLRHLFSRRASNLIWPCCVIGLGIYMAFFYRESV
jgi:putative copper resistance protein D